MESNIEQLNIIVNVWAIIIGALITIAAVFLTACVNSRVLHKERKAVESAKKIHAIRSLIDEVESIIVFASKPWNSRMITLPDDVWRSNRNEFSDMTPDTHSKLRAFYLEVNQLNSIVNTDIHKVHWGGGYLDKAYQDQCIVVKDKGNELMPLLQNYYESVARLKIILKELR